MPLNSNAQATDTKDLTEIARSVRQHIVRMTSAANSGHPGGALSAADIVTALYFRVMKGLDPNNPRNPDRDRFILSKGHACPVLYGVLAEKGYIPRELVLTFRKLHSILQGHPDMNKVPGVDMSAGSLGQGLSAGVGMALAAQLDNRNYRVYVMLGDGECQEGQVWEAAMAGAHYKLDNLIAIVDRNGLQIDGPTETVMGLDPLQDKWASFGWHVIEIDGHSFPEILAAFDEASSVKEKPVVIIARTIKGKGVSFMENAVEWHGTAPSAEQRDKALAELGGI